MHNMVRRNSERSALSSSSSSSLTQGSVKRIAGPAGSAMSLLSLGLPPKHRRNSKLKKWTKKKIRAIGNWMRGRKKKKRTGKNVNVKNE